MFQNADPHAKIREGGQLVRIGKLSACRMCELLPTKPTPQTEDSEAMVNRIERLIAERDAGFPIDPDTITRLDAEGVVYWTRYMRLREITQAQMQQELLMSALGMTPR